MSAVVALAAQAASSGHGGSKSPVALLVIGVVFLAVGGAQAVNPRFLWRMNRWAYKNPDAMEPSAKGFAVQRVAGGVIAIIGIVLVVVAFTKF